MATPVGHYLVGISLAQAFARNDRERRQVLLMGTVAVLPDLDVLPGLAVGNLAQFHHDISHSLLAAAAFSVAGLFFLMWNRSTRTLYITLVSFLLYTSHLLLDFLTLDTGAPFGIPLFWPFITQTYESPWFVLPNVQHTIVPLFGVHNALLVFRELLIFLPLAGLIYTLKAPRLPWPRSLGWLFGSWFMIATGVSAYLLNNFGR